MNNTTDDWLNEPGDFLEILPVSVIDIAAQGKREAENHGSTSSRANYSPFPEEIAKLCYQFYLRDASHIFDPFAGWGERSHFAREQGKRYTGYDLSPTAIAKAAEMYGADNVLADSRTAPIPAFDGLLTCPPYWNLEKYAAADGCDRAKTFGEFCDQMKTVFERCVAAAAPGSVFCVMVGDWRKNHVYYDLDWRMASILGGAGLVIVDKVVVSRKKVSKIKIMLPQAKRLGYSVRVHENLLVYRKPK